MEYAHYQARKIKDCKEFLEFKNINDENITKLDNLWDKVNFVLFD
jgi:hypothetical protein